MTEIVETVLGPVSPHQLGRTLTHEHLAMEFTHFYQKPPSALVEKFRSMGLAAAFSLDTVGYLRQYPYSSQLNMVLNDKMSEDAVMKDVMEYKKYGGGTIVENSTEGLKRNVTFYKDVSTKTGVNLVAGTGYYIADMQTVDCLQNNTENMYEHMLKELTIGCVEDQTVKAGFMGEIASIWPLKDFERKAIQAAGELQTQVGCGVSFHPHREPAAPFEIIRLYLEAGGQADKVVMSHLDRTLLKDEELLEFAKLGVYCQFDLFGVEVSYYQLNESTDMPSDSQRIEKIKLLEEDGREDRILMSHDIHTKHRLINFGGHGYSHIINNVLPRMRLKGFSQETIDKITIQNPARWLSMPQTC